MKIGAIVIKCKKFDEMLAFWQEALHYVLGMQLQDGFVILIDPEEKSANLSLDKALEGEHVGSPRNPRLHLDLYTNDQIGEVKRLLGIGAKRYPQTYDPEDDFVVLEDPDGNLFCVVQT
jgi:catechol 2,3-dioxygenase-like lactoylglutathione lyase family enzyme